MAGSSACTFDPAGTAALNLPSDIGPTGIDGSVELTDAGVDPADASIIADSSTPTRCGDGQIDLNEACDDGNLSDEDGCNANCTVQAGWGCQDEPSRCLALPILELLDTVVFEGEAAQIVVQLSFEAPFTVRMQWYTEDDTASAPGDYVIGSGQSVEILPGQRRATISIQTVSDGQPEPSEQFKVSLRNIENARIGDPHALATIEDGDSLTDAGLVARYYLEGAVPDEELPATFSDSSPNPFDLRTDERIIGGPNPFEATTGRGVEWTSRGANGRIGAQLGDSKIRQRLDRVRSASMEAVAHIESTANASRIIHLGRRERGQFSLLIADEIYLAHDNDLYAWPIPQGLIGRRAIFTLVYDSGNAADSSRLRLYIDGVDQGPADDTISQNTEIRLASNDSLVLGNRTGGGYSFKGRLYYAALYDQALGPDEVAHNAMVLLNRDDP